MAESKARKETPLMKQYNAMKSKYPGALLLFRVGDFYETFGKDAIVTSKVLDIVLTKRSNGAASEVELAGFPHHALDSYLPKLVRAGHRVAICDQLEDPKQAKGIVKRGVTELVTPGVSFNDNVLETRKNNFLASVSFGESFIGISFLDVSTGEFLATQGDEEYVLKLFQGFDPSEVIFSKSKKREFQELLGEDLINYSLDDWIYQKDFAYEKLTGHFKTNNLKGYGIDHLDEAIKAAGAILNYLEDTEHHEMHHIASVSRIDEETYVWLDKFTIRNLELIYAQQEGGIPLISVLDQTTTPMGSRLLRKWTVLPLKDIQEIRRRQQIVDLFTQSQDLLDELTIHLKQIGDLERLISKVAVSRINPRELLQLKRSLDHLVPIRDALDFNGEDSLKEIAAKLDPCDELRELITNSIMEDAPMLVNQGNVIAEGVNESLDELRNIAFSGKDVLVTIQQREQKNTGIPSLKIGYNKVFGYYLEVTNSHKDKVPEEWIRKQTLVNAERYITEELKVYEEKIVNAESQIAELEQKLFAEVVTKAGKYTAAIQDNARIVGEIDCLVSFSIIAVKNNYTRPSIDDSFAIDIKEGRHPVIEHQMPPGEDYVPNDVFLNTQDNQILIITGPNMAGKSALLRQTALIVLMAQMGSFVPASSATIGIVDKVFTRVGASDNLTRGESTFMVEMTETASILNNMSERSLILMDEIGRGTSTYDGVSIAWSIVEYLHNHPNYHPKTLFATHYHELNQLKADLPRIRNFNVSVKEVGDKVLFVRKLKEGGTEHSFGIHVAQMAGMPNPVVIRAHEIMRFLEKDRDHYKDREKMKELPVNEGQLPLFQSDPRFKKIVELLENLDINTIPPVEALLKLNELKEILRQK